MWHLKTKQGTFWILPPEEASEQYVLGIDEETLGYYTKPEAAVEDIQAHETGCLRWDEMVLDRPIPNLTAWFAGAPACWESVE